MPLQVVEANQKVAEVRFVCDRCNKLFGVQLLLVKDIADGGFVRTFCSNCRNGDPLCDIDA